MCVHAAKAFRVDLLAIATCSVECVGGFEPPTKEPDMPGVPAFGPAPGFPAFPGFSRLAPGIPGFAPGFSRLLPAGKNQLDSRLCSRHLLHFPARSRQITRFSRICPHRPCRAHLTTQGGLLGTAVAPYGQRVGFVCMGGAPKGSPNRPRHPQPAAPRRPPI